MSQVMEPPAGRPCRDTRWESVGPNHISGAIRQVLVDPTDSGRLYAASANGGVWRLDDLADYPDGQVWRPLTDRLPDIRARAVAVAPGDGRVVYFANSLKRLRAAPPVVLSEIYRSANRGVTWRAVHGPGMGVVHRLAVHPANAAVVFAATSTGLWRQNAAAPGSWTNTFPDDCLDVALDPDDSSILYLGVRNRGLFKSFTSGADWTPAPILPFDPAAAGGNRRATLVALGVRNADGSPQTPATRTVAVRFGNELCLSHTAGEGALPFSRHVPTREVPNPSPPPATVDRAPDDLNGGSIRRSDTDPRFASEWANCLAVDPFDPQHVLMGSVTLLETRDGGVTWRAVSTPHEDQQSVSFDATRRGVVYLASDGGVFSSVDGGATWPTMGLADTMPAPNRGLNLAMGLVTSELDRSYVRAGRAVAAIDHTGFVLSDDLSDRWQFLFNRPDRSARHAHENGFVYPCPASPDRCYVINTRVTDDPTGVTLRLAQLDFTRTGGLVDPPAFSFLSPLRASLPGDNGAYKPEDHIYLENLPGPFAAQVDVATGERLLLFGAESTPAVGGFSVQSLRLAAAGTTVTAAATEVVSAEPFFALTFAPGAPGRAFAITRSGTLFERDFSTPGPFAASAALALGPGDLFVSRLVAVHGADLRLFALTQHALHRLVHRPGAAWATLVSWPDPDETLLSLTAQPGRDGTLFLGTNRGVYLSEDDGLTWRPFNTALPSVAVTELTFDQGSLCAATFGRGLWRCRPCT